MITDDVKKPVLFAGNPENVNFKNDAARMLAACMHARSQDGIMIPVFYPTPVFAKKTPAKKTPE